MPIDDYPIRGSINTGITYSQDFEIWQAAVAANLDLERVWSGTYNPRFIEKVIAWWTRKNQLEAHNADAVNRPKGKK